MELNSKTIIQLINQVGFPVVVAVWFMFRTDKKLDKVVSLQNKILDLIERRIDNG